MTGADIQVPMVLKVTVHNNKKETAPGLKPIRIERLLYSLRVGHSKNMAIHLCECECECKKNIKTRESGGDASLSGP